MICWNTTKPKHLSCRLPSFPTISTGLFKQTKQRKLRPSTRDFDSEEGPQKNRDGQAMINLAWRPVQRRWILMNVAHNHNLTISKKNGRLPCQIFKTNHSPTWKKSLHKLPLKILYRVRNNGSQIFDQIHPSEILAPTFRVNESGTWRFRLKFIGCRCWVKCAYMGVSKNRGTPKIIHFNRVFHYKPSILGYHYFRKHPYKDVFDLVPMTSEKRTQYP